MTYEQEISMCNDIISAVKEVWGRHGGDRTAALMIGVDGPEIVSAIMDVIEKYEAELSGRKDQQTRHPDK